MALTVSGSPHSGDSQSSPSPDILSDISSSNNASPVSIPTTLYMSAPFEEAESSNMRSKSNPARPVADLTRSHSAGKGGCWTCRIRRKKCDEEREGDSCKTCRRLKLKCLGWGAKRPDWMRDKERVAEYRASIKEQLTRAGMIRGQPRTTFMQTAVVPSQVPLGMPGPGPRTQGTRAPDYSSRSNWGTSAHYPASSSAVPAMQGAAITTGGSFLDLPFQNYQYHGTTPPNVPLQNHEEQFFAGFSPISRSDYGGHRGMPVPSDSPNPPMQEVNYVNYYFERVLPLQFAFAGGPPLRHTLHSIIMADPNGTFANATCALASLHLSSVRLAQGLEVPHYNPEQSPPKQFYDRAFLQLVNTKSLHGHYAETDAVAAVQLVGFSVLSGGWTEWTAALDIACEWLSQTGIHEEQNPKLTLHNMSPAARFAAKATMWIDVFSSITFMHPPRFLSLYRRLFAEGAGYWGSAAQAADLRMETLSGCPDEVMLAIAEVSWLAHWKETEQRNGSLSVRELIRRGDEIEQQLRHRGVPHHLPPPPHRHSLPAPSQQPQPQPYPLGGELVGQNPPLDGNAMMVGMSGLPSGSASASGSVSVSPTTSTSSTPSGAPTFTGREAARLAAEIFRETAILYLHTVLSDSLPGVPEISSSVELIFGLLAKLPPSNYDNGLTFPLFICGCMTDNTVVRDTIRQRFQMIDDQTGKINATRTVMENTWLRRAAATQSQRSPVPSLDWRTNAQLGSLLLL